MIAGQMGHKQHEIRSLGGRQRGADEKSRRALPLGATKFQKYVKAAAAFSDSSVERERGAETERSPAVQRAVESSPRTPATSGNRSARNRGPTEHSAEKAAALWGQLCSQWTTRTSAASRVGNEARRSLGDAFDTVGQIEYCDCVPRANLSDAGE